MICTFERKIFENKATGYCVVSFKTEDTTVPAEAQSGKSADKKIRFTGVGYGIPATGAIDLEIDGRWEKSKYGLQFVIEHFAEILPKTIDGIIGYLASGLISGVSEITARKITDKFGLESLDIIENSPSRLNEIRGLSDKSIAKIVNSYSQNKGLRNIVSFLSPFGITLKKSMKIHEMYGEKAMEVLNERPFELCDISGFGFKTVDAIARKIKCKPNDKMRIKAAANQALAEAMGEGHVYLDQRELRDKCFSMLNEGFSNVAVTGNEIREALIESIRSKRIINNNGHLYMPAMFAAEVELVKNITVRTFLKPNISGDVEQAIAWAQAKYGIVLSTAQATAVKTCFENNLSIITGGPGTGKTTVLKVLLAVYKTLSGKSDILLAAPTGRAAKRMAESTGMLTAKTLHSALGLYSDDTEESLQISEGLVVIDEMSMVDLRLAHKLFTSVSAKSMIVLVGDADQLPSVGPGNVLGDILASECVACTRLDTVFRQTGASRISLNAEKIRTNETTFLYGSDFNFITADTEADALEIVKQCYLNEVERIGMDNVQILAPFRSRGDTSVNHINGVIREIVNPFVGERNDLFCDGKVLRLNDRVLQTKNKNGINNGDVGVIKSVYEADEEKHALIEFSDGMQADYTERELDIIELAYATTIHKSQGSEYATVIIPMLKSYYIMLKRNLIYTAITRAKKKVILVGQKQAFMMAVHKNDSAKRNSMLGKRIMQYVQHITDESDKRKDVNLNECNQ